MTKYMVMFDPLTHADQPYAPPAEVQGNIMGDTDRGLMGVYVMPPDQEEKFLLSLEGCPSVLGSKRLES